MAKWPRSRVRRTIRKIGRWGGWAAVVLLLLMALTGYGISQFRLVSGLTFGALNKAVSHRLHHYVNVPLIVFALVHVLASVWGRLSASRNKRRT